MNKLFYLFFFFTLITVAQPVYHPISKAPESKKEMFINQLKHNYELKIDEISDKYSGKKRKFLKNLYQSQLDRLLINIEKGELYFNRPNKQYLQKILDEIIQNNSSFIKKCKFFIDFSRNTSPNAYSVGDGTLIIHLNLLNYLKTEDELAGIIAHEISHDLLKHRDKSYENLTNKLFSKEFKEAQKKVFRNRYGQQERAEELLKGTVYSRKHKSRKQEYEADSLGLILLANTRYNIDAPIKSLYILDSVDTEKDSINIALLKKLFTTEHQKFNEDWLFQEDFSDYTYIKDKNWNQDSLKTHPDCKNRIIKLENIKKKLAQAHTSNFSVDAGKFDELKKISTYETIYNHYFFKEYGIGLYQTMKALAKHPNDPFYLKMFSLFLDKLSEAKKEMALNRYIPSIDPPNQSKSFQLFINFINNLTGKEWERITNDYRNKTKNINIK